MNQEMQHCLQNCLHCHSVCLSTVTYCLLKGGDHAEAAHIRLLLDCAEICQTSVNFLLRDSELYVHTCAACAQVCQRCAQACERMSDDAQMAACADACRRCAQSCQWMATQTM